MDISVVILAYNEEKNIGECLRAVLNQKYTSGEWDVLVIDGDSTDDTVKIVQEIQKTSARIRLLSNKKRKIASGRNLGLTESRYPFVAFTDADCIVSEDWLNKLSKGYKNMLVSDDKPAGVGGGNIPPELSSRFQQALGLYLDSFLGSFNSPQGRNFSEIRKVESLACLNALYKKEALMEVGGFDENMGNIAEDRDMNIRLRKHGYSLYFIPDTSVFHKLRNDLIGWMKNMALYGRGRAVISFKHNLFLNPFFILPMIFILSMILVPLGFFNSLFFSPLLYFPFIFSYALAISIKNKKLNLFPDALAIFIATHFVYSFNLLFKSFAICYNTPDRNPS